MGGPCNLSYAAFGALLAEGGAVFQQIWSACHERHQQRAYPPPANVNRKGRVCFVLSTVFYILTIPASLFLFLMLIGMKNDLRMGDPAAVYFVGPAMSGLINCVMWVWIIGSIFLLSGFYRQKKFFPRRLILPGISLLVLIITILFNNHLKEQGKKGLASIIGEENVEKLDRTLDILR